jgi:molybdopterin-guanine dinucleotide biosynthesis protein
MRERPTIVAVGGFGSDSGKTTLVCELLRALPGAGAVKTTRGHYRSCGKDPLACCVSPLLGAEPLVRSGRGETYAAGKDTGRYWDAGASEVHWVIATDAQVEEGFRRALGRVAAPLVLVEGNSFLKYFEADYVVMAASVDSLRMKRTARAALRLASAFYLSSASARVDAGGVERFADFLARVGCGDALGRARVFTRETLGELVSRVREVHGRAGAAGARGVSPPARASA